MQSWRFGIILWWFYYKICHLHRKYNFVKTITKVIISVNQDRNKSDLSDYLDKMIHISYPKEIIKGTYLISLT
jgi:hypothetical protein